MAKRMGTAALCAVCKHAAAHSDKRGKAKGESAMPTARKLALSAYARKAHFDYFLSLSYSNLIQPVPIPADSNPRITWGKYFEETGRVFIPVTVLCHHALVDGVHIGRFYNNPERQLRLHAQL